MEITCVNTFPLGWHVVIFDNAIANHHWKETEIRMMPSEQGKWKPKLYELPAGFTQKEK